MVMVAGSRLRRFSFIVRERLSLALMNGQCPLSKCCHCSTRNYRSLLWTFSVSVCTPGRNDRQNVLALCRM